MKEKGKSTNQLNEFTFNSIDDALSNSRGHLFVWSNSNPIVDPID